MPGLAANYVKDVWDQRKVNAIYPPGEALKVGDIYEYDEGVYRFRSTLSSRGQRVTSRPSPGKRRWTAQSRNTSRIVTKLSGKLPKGIVTSALGKADAGAVVQFSDENAYVMSLSDITIRQVTNLDAIGDTVSQWFWRNDWDSYFLIVTEVWDAKSATILTSGADETQVELAAKAKLTTGSISLADIGAGFTMADSGRAIDQLVGQRLTPLFRAHHYSPTRGRMVPAGRRGGHLDFFVNDLDTRNLSPAELKAAKDTPTMRFTKYQPTIRA